MSAAALEEWLRRLETRTPPERIELGLERVAEVWQRLGSPRLAQHTIVVAGTNGKGSCVALAEAFLQAQGLVTAAYTSPHLLRFTERLRIAGEESNAQDWVAAFEVVEKARQQTQLTYFEFTTLAAFWVMAQQSPALDVALLEVGLGGRLDAVNVMDADAVLLTSIDLDHQDWLGTDREQIGAEKAGVLRAGQVAVSVEASPPDSVVQAAAALGVSLLQRDRDYQRSVTGEHWEWRDATRTEHQLPFPALAGAFQLDHAAAVLTLLQQLGERGDLPSLTRNAIEHGLRSVRLAGRRQMIPRNDQGGMWLLDVAHNPHAAIALADELAAMPARAWCVLGMLKDKDNAAFVAALRPAIEGWFLIGLKGTRGQPAAGLAMRTGLDLSDAYEDLGQAMDAAEVYAASADCIVITGSFHTVAAALTYLQAAR
ncbi:MAG: bifunctional tetrahydrofolate synthase/dihydrofolate synthase [Gammaproteobacteria bacterium]